MHKDWPAMASELSAAIKQVRLGTPDVMKSFSAMASAATATGALDSKTKELMTMAIAVAIRCDGCVAFHAKAAQQHGATREEIMEVARETLEGNLRGVLATLTPDQVNRDKEAFAVKLTEEAEHDLNRIGLALDTLSMGMTGDLDAAIHAGSTMVRVGTAIFGGRG